MYLLGVKFKSETSQIQNLNFVKLNVPVTQWWGGGGSWEMEDVGFDRLQIVELRGKIIFHLYFIVSLQVSVSKPKENAFKYV